MGDALQIIYIIGLFYIFKKSQIKNKSQIINEHILH